MYARKVRVLPHLDDNGQLLWIWVRVKDSHLPFRVSPEELRSAQDFVGNPRQQSTYRIHRTEVCRLLARSKMKKKAKTIAIPATRMDINDFDVQPIPCDLNGPDQMPFGMPEDESSFDPLVWEI
jgi:hypothetical protein